MSEAKVSIGVDIGGTFTDIVLLASEGSGQRVIWTKSASTPRRPVDGVLAAVSKGLARLGLGPSSVSQFMHATTVGTNAVLEHKGAKLGIIMTEGFEDTLEIGRQKRSQMYEVFLEPETPTFLCPRDLRVGVSERVAHTGEVLIPLEDSQVQVALDRFRSEGVRSVAICYLFSFQNPEHELSTRRILEAQDPDISTSLSHEINPVFREYERLCVTAFDAYLRPVMENYMAELLLALQENGIAARVQTMKSRGGLASTDGALQRPVTTMLSGPAAGVIGARFVARMAGRANVVTLDMGGTSADIAVVKEGKPLTSTRGGIGRYPLNIPMVDVQTIGAGGGSIAWLDAAGGLRVGPESAGSDPGPACYGQGGDRPTVTDASLVLGYLDPEYFLGGAQQLDMEAAWKAIKGIATHLGLSVHETALGIHRIVNAKMADAIRLASIKRGHDLRQFSLMVFGGAGPVNGGPLATELGIDRCIMPRSPGVLSALGLLVSNIEYDNAQTFLEPLASADVPRGNEILERLTISGLKQMVSDGFSETDCEVHYSADMRYVGQSSELEVPIPEILSESVLREIELAFHAEHERVYGYAPPDAPIEFVNLRAVHVRAPSLDVGQSFGSLTSPATSEQPARKRRCYFSEGDFETPVFSREQLPTSFRTMGPAIIQQEDTTMVLYPGYSCHIDEIGNVIMERGV